jgi:S-adenosylmethionine decarboxylase
MFGPHLTLDLYGCDKKILSDVKANFRFLDTLPGKIGMTKIMPPYVFEYSGLRPEEWGVSGIVLIAESHISIHTFPEKGYASFDMFSCNDFDIERVSEMVVKLLGAKTYEKNVLMRGRHFPKSVERNAKLLNMQRTQVEKYRN